MKRQRLDDATLRWLAVKASVDPRSIEKILRGEPVRGLAGHRIRVVLQAEGLLDDAERGGMP